MSVTAIIQQLKINKAIFKAEFSGIPEKMYHWKEEKNKWSLLEILCHLYDEERDDFRTRLKHCLENPDQQPPPIHPEEWVISRDYANQNYEEMLPKFLAEREASIVYLESLSDVNWAQAYEHQEFGLLSAGLFLSNWLAHDYLHFRQITRLKYHYLKLNLTEEDLRYAGLY